LYANHPLGKETRVYGGNLNEESFVDRCFSGIAWDRFCRVWEQCLSANVLCSNDTHDCGCWMLLPRLWACLLLSNSSKGSEEWSAQGKIREERKERNEGKEREEVTLPVFALISQGFACRLAGDTSKGMILGCPWLCHGAVDAPER
jgi:hypothetical protein